MLTRAQVQRSAVESGLRDMMIAEKEIVLTFFISKSGQAAMREVIDAALRRIECDPQGIPVRLYPFTRADDIKDAPAMIAIAPNLSAGRPVITGTELAVQLISERYKAGESINDLAQDYECSHEGIEEAVRCEFPAAA